MGRAKLPDPVARDVLLYPLLGRGELLAHDLLGILGEVRVPQGVAADLETVAGQVLELAAGQLFLVEETVGGSAPGST